MKDYVTDFLSQSSLLSREASYCASEFPLAKSGLIWFPPCSTVNSSPTVKTLEDQPISRVENIRIELHNLVFFSITSSMTFVIEQVFQPPKKEKLGLTYNTVGLSASHPPVKSAVSTVPHNTRLCWFHMRGALFGLCPTCGGSAAAQYSGGKCDLSC